MRAFIALELPDDLRDEVACLARGLARSVEGRFVPFENYHLTLAFLGDVDEAHARGALAIDIRIAVRCAAPTLDPMGLGTFGRTRSTTLFLDIRPSEPLAELARAVRAGLDERGIGYDPKPFRPHITLARRVRIPHGALPALVFPAPVRATRATLFKSTLTPEGALYKPLYTVELGIAR